jgi:hypothetical protein
MKKKVNEDSHTSATALPTTMFAVIVVGIASVQDHRFQIVLEDSSRAGFRLERYSWEDWHLGDCDREMVKYTPLIVPV